MPRRAISTATASASAVIVTACDRAYQAALDLHAAGVGIAEIADIRSAPSGALPEAARRAGIAVRPRSTVLSTDGDLRVRAIELGEIDIAGHFVFGGTRRLRRGFDVRWIHAQRPLVLSVAGQTRMERGAAGLQVPGRSAEHERSAGACRGCVTELAPALADGAAAGATPTPHTHSPSMQRERPRCVPRFLYPRQLRRAPASPSSTGGARCRARPQLRRARRFPSNRARQALHDHGNGHRIRAKPPISMRSRSWQRLDAPVTQVGLTTFRMPYTPVTFGGFAGVSVGALFDPKTPHPTHEWAAANGAVFETWACGSARVIFRAPARVCMPRSQGVPGGAQCLRHLRCIDLGKNRSCRRDAAEFMNRL